MKVLLVNPNVLSPAVFPVGMEYIAEHLMKKAEHDITIIDMNVDDQLEAATQHQHLVLIAVRNLDSGMSNEDFELQKTLAVVQRIRAVYQGPIGVAGSAVNLSAEGVRTYLGVEYALVSKGFGAIDELLSRFQAEEHVEPGVIRDYRRPVMGHFERNIIDKTYYLRDGGHIGVATKFGCPFNCQYCDYPAVDGRIITKRPPEEIVEEIHNLRKQGANRVFFADAQFNIPVKHGISILQRMLEEGLEDVDWDAFINPHRKAFTQEFAQLLTRFGKTEVHFGVDSLSDPILLELGKGFTVADIKNAVRICRDVGLKVGASMLFGHPAETVETVEESFRNIDDIGFDMVEIGSRVRIYPETPLFDIAVKQGIIAANDPLLHPAFYPAAEGVVETVFHLAEQRQECIGHVAGASF